MAASKVPLELEETLQTVKRLVRAIAHHESAEGALATLVEVDDEVAFWLEQRNLEVQPTTEGDEHD